MKKFLLRLFILSGASLFSQDDLLAELELESEPEIQFVKATWKSPYLINVYTTETERKGILDFRISHRFGNLAGESGGGHSLFGLDKASNIRFSFDYGVTEDFQIGIGRSKTNEHLDFLLKYKLLKQKKEGSTHTHTSDSMLLPGPPPNTHLPSPRPGPPRSGVCLIGTPRPRRLRWNPAWKRNRIRSVAIPGRIRAFQLDSMPFRAFQLDSSDGVPFRAHPAPWPLCELRRRSWRRSLTSP